MTNKHTALTRDSHAGLAATLTNSRTRRHEWQMSTEPTAAHMTQTHLPSDAHIYTSPLQSDT